MGSISWPRVFVGGVLWVMVYNLVWGIAWIAFMHREWLDAMAAIKRPLPWIPQFWVMWVALTLPIGIATMAYVASRLRSVSAQKSALYAGLALWMLMTMGMAGWGWRGALPIRVIALDSTVNLVALVAASLAGGWNQRGAYARPFTPAEGRTGPV